MIKRRLNRDNYKVIELTRNNGEVYFKVKYKYWYGWRYMDYQPGPETRWDYEFKTLKDACKHIADEILYYENRLGERIKTTREVNCNG